MGIDYGDRQIGIAVSDELGFAAHGIAVIRNSGGQALEEIANLAKEHGVSELVVGLPKNMNGTVGPRGKLAEQFAEKLETASGLPVVLWDERLTTMSAERMLIGADVSRKKRKTVVDKIAAALILQNYLDFKSMRGDWNGKSEP